MKKDSKKLAFIALVAFIIFLISFAGVFYLYGAHGGIDALVINFIFPIYYFVLTVVALVMMHNVIITKRPYIVMAILSCGLVLVLWIVNIIGTLCVEGVRGFVFSNELWIPIVVTVLSLVMSICYISLIVDIVKVDNKIKRNNQNDKE